MIFVKGPRKKSYLIQEDGRTLGVVDQHFVDKRTRRTIDRSDIGFVPMQFVWARGWSIIWDDLAVERGDNIRKREIYRNLYEIHVKYNFENFPGPRGVLKLTKRHKDYVTELGDGDILP